MSILSCSWDVNIVKKVGEEETVIKVEQSMVTSCDSTLSTGNKSMTISHEGQEFKVGFTVKYRVEFKSGDDIISTQYVLASNQIDLPDDPIKSGFEFDGWSPKVPSVINDNMVFVAEFRDVPKEIPNLASSYDAVYGDTLADIDLPTNSYGSWEFIDALNTPVGNVGKNSFTVQFVPKNQELTKVQDIVNIYVSKMKLDFNFTKLQFDYDGEEHTPEYTLVNTKGETINDPAITVNYTGQTGKDVV